MPRKSPRHRILDNLLGTAQFSPLVRKTKQIVQFEKKQLHCALNDLTNKYEQDLVVRATRYLFTKETMASWEIEKEKPDKDRLARFTALLQQNYNNQEFSKRFLLMIQKEIVDPRFALEDYRSFQKYVGEEARLGEMIVHYIAPRPEDLHCLMEGLIQCATRIFASKLDAVVCASIVSFAFVFMHPFWDGNGRLHRFLIHYTLSRLGFAPEGIVFPVSAVMLREYKEYDKALEHFSCPLNQLICDYQLDEKAELRVFQETIDYYRYMDLTFMTEFTYKCVEQTLYMDFEKELKFLHQYDKIKLSIKQIIDMPDKEINLFIRQVRQNNGVLSKRKRDSWTAILSDEEIDSLEDIIRKQLFDE
ncbi:MAG: cell filamentation protein Fic [Chlamydiae bacterium]|nr:cell filamentation protein Fic [Chlamydiota bacterium]